MDWFESMEEAKEKIEGWRRDYNETRAGPTPQRERIGHADFAECSRRMRRTSSMV